MLAVGKDPLLENRREKVRSLTEAGNTFASIATEYYDKGKNDGEKG